MLKHLGRGGGGAQAGWAGDKDGRVGQQLPDARCSVRRHHEEVDGSSAD